jgi:tRNA (guanosine-2'-O-)-methyltransferase
MSENESKTIRAVNRRELSTTSLGKTSKWPRTDRRAQRIEGVLRHRQPDLTLVLENITDAHNVSAILRGCDAVGIDKVHLIYSTEEGLSGGLARTTSASASKWLTVETHSSVEECYSQLRQAGFMIVGTALEERSVDLYEVDFTVPVAVVMGTEIQGLTEEAKAGAHHLITIPMMGMVESLNVSVASAVTLYEALRQRRAAGQYDRPKFDEAELGRRTAAWLEK